MVASIYLVLSAACQTYSPACQICSHNSHSLCRCHALRTQSRSPNPERAIAHIHDTHAFLRNCVQLPLSDEVPPIPRDRSCLSRTLVHALSQSTINRQAPIPHLNFQIIRVLPRSQRLYNNVVFLEEAKRNTIKELSTGTQPFMKLPSILLLSVEY